MKCMLEKYFLSLTRALLILTLLTSCSRSHARSTVQAQSSDSATVKEEVEIIDPTVIHRLTDDDYKQAAHELGIDVASIKAVIEIEAGQTHQGFYKPNQPIINFDLTMFKKWAARHGIKLGKYSRSNAVVFARPNAKKYGSYQAAQYERLKSALSIDSIAAIEGTFWGMFQIGGFNWKKCGTESPVDFARRMSTSEKEQLELFVNFLKSNNLVKYLKAKNWAGFALRYNGPSYAKRGYHTRLAKAYSKYKKQSKK